MTINQITNAPTNNEVIDKVNEIICNMVGYGTSDSVADAVTKVVSIPSITTLNTGQIIIVKPSVTSTVASSTIKLNDFDAYPMRYNNAAISTSTDSIVWNENFVSTFIFDGTYWQFAGHGYDNNTNTTYSAMSVSEGTTGTATNSRTVRADYLKQIIQGTTLTGLSTSTNSAVVATDSITTGIGKLQAQINASKILINITYADLVTLKTNGELYEGAFYRIVDYVTTSNGASPNNNEPSRSAGHQFDIIIQALGNSNLADKGTCALHSGDTYFANNNLGAWTVYYDIENDTNKYAWADTTNGKGVIYRMIDEFGNDLPYDFKNIQYYRDSANYSSLSTYLTASDGYYFTFSQNTSGTITDKSLNANTHDNVIGTYTLNAQLLINTVFVHTDSTIVDTNNIGSVCYNNTICGSCYGNSIAMLFHDNIIGNNFYYNTLGQTFRNNTIGSDFYANTIGNYCYSNTFSSGFTVNVAGDYFDNNTFSGVANNNTIMQNVHDVTAGANFNYNILGNATSNLTIGTGCQVNVFNNNVRYMTIPNSMLNLDIASRTLGTSSAYLDLSGLPTNAKYPIFLRRDVNSSFIATWNDGITTYGKYKANSSTATWTDVNNKQIQADWNQSDNTAVDYIKNKPTIPSGVIVDQTYDGTSANAQSGVAIEGELANYVKTSDLSTVATSGSYNDLSNKPTIPDTSNLANKDLSNLSSTGNAKFQEPISDLATIRSGASAGATAVQPSDITDVVLQETTDSLYCWSNNSATPQNIYTINSSYESGVTLVFNDNFIALSGEAIVTPQGELSYKGSIYTRNTSNDILSARQTLTDNNSNALNITQADGQWVHKYFEVATNTATNSYSHDLSSYLPSDNYSYEVFLRIGCYYKSSNASFTVGTVASPNTNKSTSGNYLVFQYVTGNSRGGYCNAIIPVGTSRTIYSQISAALDNSTIELFGYRRIGTNS